MVRDGIGSRASDSRCACVLVCFVLGVDSRLRQAEGLERQLAAAVHESDALRRTRAKDSAQVPALARAGGTLAIGEARATRARDAHSGAGGAAGRGDQGGPEGWRVV